MANETPTLIAERRERTGSRYAKRLRRAGRLPAVIYGHQEDPVAVSVDQKETIDALRKGSHIVTVDIGGKGETCLVKDLQFGYLGDDVIHVDFTRVNLDEEVTVNVHLHFTGEPEAAKQPGAVLTTDLTELEIVCKASDIPHEIVVDLGQMEQSITVGEVQLPPGTRTDFEPDTPVAHIDWIAEEAAGEEVEVVGEEEPEIITEAAGEEEGAAPAASPAEKEEETS